MDDPFEAGLFLFGQRPGQGKFLIDTHPRRAAPTAVIPAAVQVAQHRASADVKDSLSFVAAQRREKDVQQIALALGLQFRVPIQNQPPKHGPQNPQRVRVLSPAIHVASPQPIPSPPAARKGVAAPRGERFAQRLLHGVDVRDIVVAGSRVTGQDVFLFLCLHARRIQPQPSDDHNCE